MLECRKKLLMDLEAKEKEFFVKIKSNPGVFLSNRRRNVPGQPVSKILLFGEELLSTIISEFIKTKLFKNSGFIMRYLGNMLTKKINGTLKQSFKKIKVSNP